MAAQAVDPLLSFSLVPYQTVTVVPEIVKQALKALQHSVQTVEACQHPQIKAEVLLMKKILVEGEQKEFTEFSPDAIAYVRSFDLHTVFAEVNEVTDLLQTISGFPNASKADVRKASEISHRYFHAERAKVFRLLEIQFKSRIEKLSSQAMLPLKQKYEEALDREDIPFALDILEQIHKQNALLPPSSIEFEMRREYLEKLWSLCQKHEMTHFVSTGPALCNEARELLAKVKEFCSNAQYQRLQTLFIAAGAYDIDIEQIRKMLTELCVDPEVFEFVSNKLTKLVYRPNPHGIAYTYKDLRELSLAKKLLVAFLHKLIVHKAKLILKKHDLDKEFSLIIEQLKQGQPMLDRLKLYVRNLEKIEIDLKLNYSKELTDKRLKKLEAVPGYIAKAKQCRLELSAELLRDYVLYKGTLEEFLKELGIECNGLKAQIEQLRTNKQHDQVSGLLTALKTKFEMLKSLSHP